MRAIDATARASMAKVGKAKDAKQAKAGGERKIAAKARTRDSLQALSKLAEQRRRSVPDRQPAADRRARCARLPSDLRHPGRPDRSTSSTSSSARTGRRCKTTAVTCSSGSRSSTRPARSWVSAASAPARSSCCCRAATSRTRCSCRSRRRRRRCWRITCRRAAIAKPGERVVQGQRLMQAASDIFLGWTKGVGRQPLPLLAPAARHEGLGRRRDDGAAGARRSTRASAGRRWRVRTPDRATRSRSPRTSARRTGSTKSITDFAERYADQNERDYRAFTDAIRSGRLEALEGV